MIDISDGLSSELLHICKQSKSGCILYEEKIPINERARQFAYKLELDPTACALAAVKIMNCFLPFTRMIIIR